ncbi:MAG: hypothetical protein Q9181_001250 [Wetmoreana brouardii]
MDPHEEHHISAGLTQQGEQAIMAKLYPTPDIERPRTPVPDLVQSIKVISKDPELTDEERLLHLHRMLELCTAEQERELQEYQAAHRQLVEHEGDFETMVTQTEIPANVYEFWKSSVDGNMNADKMKMKKSRENTQAILKAIRYAEEKVTRTEKTVASQKEQSRLIKQFDRFVEQEMNQIEDSGELDELEQNIREMEEDEVIRKAIEGYGLKSTGT